MVVTCESSKMLRCEAEDTLTCSPLKVYLIIECLTFSDQLLALRLPSGIRTRMEGWKPSLVSPRPELRGPWSGPNTGAAEGDGRLGWMRNGSGTEDAGKPEQAWGRGRLHGGPLADGHTGTDRSPERPGREDLAADPVICDDDMWITVLADKII